MTWKKTKPTEYKKIFRRDHKEHMANVATFVIAGLIVETPVDTGYAAASWIPSVGEASSERLPAGQGDYDINQPIAKAAQEFKIDNFDAFDALYISNNVEYLPVLNYGRPEGQQWSMKAPLMFVEGVLMEVADEF